MNCNFEFQTLYMYISCTLSFPALFHIRLIFFVFFKLTYVTIKCFVILSSLYVVSRYQDEDSKRAIMRLEQGAYSYMQRAIASHGAFAILYGRRSKHYIKKPEVFKLLLNFYLT